MGIRKSTRSPWSDRKLRKWQDKQKALARGEISPYMQELFRGATGDYTNVPEGKVSECLQGVTTPWNAYMSCGTTETGLDYLPLAAVVGSQAWQDALNGADESTTVQDFLADVFRSIQYPRTPQAWEQLYMSNQDRRKARISPRYGGTRKSRSRSRGTRTSSREEYETKGRTGWGGTASSRGGIGSRGGTGRGTGQQSFRQGFSEQPRTPLPRFSGGQAPQQYPTPGFGGMRPKGGEEEELTSIGFGV